MAALGSCQLGWWGKQIPAHRGFLKTFVILTSKMYIIKPAFLISFHTAYHEEKKRFKDHKSEYSEQKITMLPLSCLAQSWGSWRSRHTEMQQVVSFSCSSGYNLDTVDVFCNPEI